MPLATRKFEDIITFTRNSAATYWDENGVLQAAAIDEPRLDHDPLTGKSLGILIEEQRTNYITDSEDPSTWVARESMTYAGSFTERGLTFGEFVPSIGGGGNALVTDAVYELISPDGLGEYSGSFIIKGNGIKRVIVRRLTAATPSTYQAVINLETGELEPFSGEKNGVLTDLGGGFYKYTYPFEFESETTGGYQIAPLDGSDSDGVNSFFVAAMQYEKGAFPTSYIPTSGSAVTRTGEVAQINDPSTWLREEFAAKISGRSFGNRSPGATFMSFQADPQDNNDRLEFRIQDTLARALSSDGSARFSDVILQDPNGEVDLAFSRNEQGGSHLAVNNGGEILSASNAHHMPSSPWGIFLGDRVVTPSTYSLNGYLLSVEVSPVYKRLEELKEWVS